MPLTGHVRDLSLPNLIQLHCNEGRPARLRLTEGMRLGMIYIAEGKVIDAETGGGHGEDAVYDMLGWENATFSVEVDTPPWRDTTIQIPWNMLVLEGLHRLDESQVVRDTAFQTALETLRTQRGVHWAILTTTEGLCRAATHAEEMAANAHYVATVGQHASAISALLERGDCEQLLMVAPDEKLIVAKRGADYFGCAFDARTSNDQTSKVLLLLQVH